MKVGKFILVNAEKVDRALHGTPNDKGEYRGGVAKEDGTYENSALLAEYDKIGGLIRVGGDKVKTGSFYDFKKKKPRVKPEVVFVFNVNGKFVEVADGVELPGQVKAARIAEEDEKPKKGKKEVVEEVVVEEEVEEEVEKSK